MRLSATAPGKLVLVGEYAVLEGAPALVAAMDRRAAVHCEAAPAHRVVAMGEAHGFTLDAGGRPQWEDTGAPPDPRWALFGAAVAQVSRHLAAAGTALPPAALQLDSDSFAAAPGGPKLGLGSSAAICVALVAALLAHAGALPVDAAPSPAAQQLLLGLAAAAHREAQGGGSGIDIAASVHGGIVRFQRPPTEGAPLQATAVRPLQGLVLLPIWAGEPTSTPAFLARVAAFKAAQPRAYWAVLERLGIHAQAAAEFWALGSQAALLTVLDAFYDALTDLGAGSGVPIVSAAHQQLHRLARAAGAAYKPSGAGGGDLGLAFCPTAAVAQRLRGRLAGRRSRCLPLAVDPVGLRVSADSRS